MTVYSPVIPSVTQTQTDIHLANGWVMDIPSAGLVSPNFQELSGLDREVSTVEVVDGGSGLSRQFHGGVVKYADLTLTRFRDGSPNDQALSTLCDTYFSTGKKVDGTFTKFHHGTVVRRINFVGLGAKKETWPSYGVDAAGEKMTYPFTCDMYQEVF